MFQTEQKNIETKIQKYCEASGIPLATLDWKPIPFSGEWGISTSFFSTAAAESRAGKKLVVGQRAQEIAGLVKDQIGVLKGISHAEAVKGYLNLFFDTAEYTRRVVDTILDEKKLFGAGVPTHQSVMVEFSHPNTHKAFHVGHLRGTILGDAICRIL
jgi:arginyl-tRNA synthetase